MLFSNSITMCRALVARLLLLLLISQFAGPLLAHFSESCGMKCGRDAASCCCRKKKSKQNSAVQLKASSSCDRSCRTSLGPHSTSDAGRPAIRAIAQLNVVHVPLRPGTFLAAHADHCLTHRQRPPPSLL